MQCRLVDDGNPEGGAAIALVGEARDLEPGCPSRTEVAAEADLVDPTSRPLPAWEGSGSSGGQVLDEADPRSSFGNGLALLTPHRDADADQRDTRGDSHRTIERMWQDLECHGGEGAHRQECSGPPGNDAGSEECDPEEETSDDVREPRGHEKVSIPPMLWVGV